MIEFLYYHSLNFLKTLDIITQWWGNKFDLEESENEEEEKFALKNFFLTSFHLLKSFIWYFTFPLLLEINGKTLKFQGNVPKPKWLLIISENNVDPDGLKNNVLTLSLQHTYIHRIFKWYLHDLRKENYFPCWVE